MLEINVLGQESYDEDKAEFVYPDEFVLRLEHSLVSLSKWESKHEKPFLTSANEMTGEELSSYIDCMVLSPGIAPDVANVLSKENLEEINGYLGAKMSATWFTDNQTKKNSEIITSEIIYYWMISAGIPFECENWHLNRLFTLLRVFAAKQEKTEKTKKSEKDAAAERRAINERNKKLLGTNG